MALAANQIVSIQRRRAHQVFVDAHDRAGPFDGPPQRRRHFQNLVGRFGLCDPGADLSVLVGGQQGQVQHFVDGLYGGFAWVWGSDNDAGTDRKGRLSCPSLPPLPMRGGAHSARAVAGAALTPVPTRAEAVRPRAPRPANPGDRRALAR